MARRWTPWAWSLAAATFLVWNLGLREAMGGGWAQTVVAVILGVGLIILPIQAARRADLRRLRPEPVTDRLEPPHESSR
ncbi:MAG: hypothetical protein WBF71_04570 [Microthrixaceae bacterium]